MGLVTMTRSQHQYKDKFRGLCKYYMASNASIMEGGSKIRIEGIKIHIVHETGLLRGPQNIILVLVYRYNAIIVQPPCS